MTNLEWLRTLSADELVDFINPSCNMCIHGGNCTKDCSCVEGKVKWLNEERVSKIKPCPFCGGKPIVDKNQNSVYCADCHMGTPWTDSIEDAIKTWNRRVGE